MSLHLALEHHGTSEHHGAHHESHDAEHTRSMVDLVRVVTHGHHHDAEAVPEHDHDATVDDAASALRPSATGIALLPLPVAPGVALAERSLSGGSPRRGPPVPLFTSHCSLLI